MLFLSSFTNRIDKKGRISVPATFRAVLAKEGAGEVYGSAGMHAACIHCCGPNYFQKMHALIEKLDPFSPERDAMAAIVFGETTPLSMDGEGRITLPAHLIAVANLQEEATFVGKGETFEIWEPQAAREHTAKAREAMRKHLRGNA